MIYSLHENAGKDALAVFCHGFPIGTLRTEGDALRLKLMIESTHHREGIDQMLRRYFGKTLVSNEESTNPLPA